MKANNLDSPLYSVIIPSYNHRSYIDSAINSVLEQTFTDFEIVVVDNYSTDGTLEYLHGLNDPRIKVVQFGNEGSIARSRNLGVAQSKGKWIAFLDSDDWWTPNKLMLAYQSSHSSADFFYHDMHIDGKSSQYPGQDLILARQLSKPIFMDLLLHGNPIATSSVILRREIFERVGGMNEKLELKGVEDFNTWLKISKLTEGFVHLKEVLGFYRLHDTNNSSAKHLIIPWSAIDEFRSELTNHQFKRVIGNFEYTIGRLAYLDKNPDLARTHLLQSLIKANWEQKLKSFWMLLLVSLRRNSYS